MHGWGSVEQLDGHVHLDLWVRGVAIDAKIFKLKIIDVLDPVTSNDLKSGEGAGLTSMLKRGSNNTFWDYR